MNEPRTPNPPDAEPVADPITTPVAPVEPLAAVPADEGTVLPPDAMLDVRLRRAGHRILLAVRAPLLLAWGLLRRRAAPPVPSLVQRILVVRTDRLGDMVLTTGALMDLRAHYRHARITVLAPAGALGLLEGHPAVDHLVPLAGRLPSELAGRFDMAIDFTPDESLSGARLVAATHAAWRAGFAAGGRQAFFTLPSPPARADRHIVELNRDLLEALGVTRRDSEPALPVSEQERARALARCAALGAAQPRVLIHPGGHYESQRWQAERFAEVIARLTESLGAACLVACGPDEEELSRRIVEATPDALPLGPLGVRELVALTSVVDLFLGNNSGPLHIATALGVPSLSLAGPTDLRRFAPRGPAARVMTRAVSCSPCGRGRCWHHTCLASIEAREVAEAARLLLDRAPERRAA
ncbi:MAG TPA: glycosyltransferase family 9 protein [Patescibacteria group bacterium]|nr:glycosyltransferase family 9 protein [Patescibacteria group bacterium]